MLGGGNSNSVPSQDTGKSLDDTNQASSELDDDIPF